MVAADSLRAMKIEAVVFFREEARGRKPAAGKK
jgi:hypothetical protein